jgi:hypothetical protein
MNPYLAVGVGLLLAVALLVWLRRSDVARDAALPLDEDQLALNLVSNRFVEQLFSEEDLLYIKSIKDRKVLRLFLRERRYLTMSWLRRLRQEALRIMGLHLRAVRMTASLHPVREATVAVQFTLFLMLHSLILFLVWAQALMEVRALTRSLARLTVELAALTRNLGQSIAPARFSGVETGS